MPKKWVPSSWYLISPNGRKSSSWQGSKTKFYKSAKQTSTQPSLQAKCNPCLLPGTSNSNKIFLTQKTLYRCATSISSMSKARSASATLVMLQTKHLSANTTQDSATTIQSTLKAAKKTCFPAICRYVKHAWVIDSLTDLPRNCTCVLRNQMQLKRTTISGGY